MVDGSLMLAGLVPSQPTTHGGTKVLQQERPIMTHSENQISPLQPIALRLQDAASYSGLSRSRLYSLMKTGEVSSFLVGGRRMIARTAIDAFFAQKVVGG
jgi:hypothetical protein